MIFVHSLTTGDCTNHRTTAILYMTAAEKASSCKVEETDFPPLHGGLFFCRKSAGPGSGTPRTRFLTKTPCEMITTIFYKNFSKWHSMSSAPVIIENGFVAKRCHPRSEVYPSGISSQQSFFYRQAPPGAFFQAGTSSGHINICNFSVTSYSQS